MGNSVINPINKEYKVSVVEKIPVKQIVLQYQKEFNVDVSNYFESLDVIKIFECNKTKYRFFYPFSIIGDGIFYENLSQQKKNYYHNRWEHQEALKYAKEGDEWLEVGSGNSWFLKELENRRISSVGLELNIREGNSFSEYYKVIKEDFFNYNPIKQKFNVIALFQVLEHIQDIRNFFIKAELLLKGKGKLIIGVPNNNPFLYVFDKYHTLNLPPHHMGLWNGDALRNIGNEFGFKVITLRYEKLSQQELDHVLNMFSIKEFSFKNFKFFLLKLIRKMFPKSFYKNASRFYRKYLVNGRNVIAVFEKND